MRAVLLGYLCDLRKSYALHYHVCAYALSREYSNFRHCTEYQLAIRA